MKINNKDDREKIISVAKMFGGFCDRYHGLIQKVPELSGLWLKVTSSSTFTKNLRKTIIFQIIDFEFDVCGCITASYENYTYGDSQIMWIAFHDCKVSDLDRNHLTTETYNSILLVNDL